MSEVIWHQASLCGFVAVLLLIAFWNLRSLRRLRPDASSRSWPRVSVLVPARNEERNIGSCLRSLLAQDYPDFQVLAIDDDSSDGTWEILVGMSQDDRRLQVLRGRPLPAGWLGKHWACHQLAQGADGDYLLFTDADTRHAPQTLRAAIAAMQAEEVDLLSGLVKEEVVSWGEKLTVPIMAWSLMSFLPLALAYKLRVPMLSAAVGQLMLFRRQAYEQVGGHTAVRSHAADDLALARLFVSRGLRWRMCDATRFIHCRMYRSLGEAAAGFGKSLFAGFDYNVLLYVPIWLWLAVVFLEPPLLLALGFLGVPVPGASALLAAAAIGLSMLLWAVVCKRTRLPAYLPLIYPLIILVTEAVAALSLLSTLAGRTDWKGRRLARAAGDKHV